MSKKINMIGQLSGSLIPEKEFGKDAEGRTLYYCKCICGSINCRSYKITTGKRLRTGTTKTCGAREHALNDLNKVKRNSLNGVFKEMYSDGDLKPREFGLICQLNCFYCGIEPQNIANSYTRAKKDTFSYKNGEIKYSGLDRFDNSLPHDLKNCVPACINCNEFKGTDYYINFIKRIKKININFEKKICSDFNYVKNEVDKFKLIGECKNSRAKTILGKVFPDDNKKYGEGASLHKQVYQRQARSKEANTIWELSLIDAAEIILASCIYCGAEADLKNKIFNTIDRYNNFDINNNKAGYTIDNCVPACMFCNCAKRDLSINSFREWISRVKNNLHNLPKTSEEVEKLLNDKYFLQLAVKNNIPDYFAT